MILIVDDRDDGRRLLGRLMALQGYRAVEAASGHEAFAIMEKATPSLVILDYNMPEMDGLAVFRKMRQDLRFAGIPVIIFSATDGAARDEALKEGVHAWVMKGSLDFAAIHREVARLIGPGEAKPNLLASPDVRSRDVG